MSVLLRKRFQETFLDALKVQFENLFDLKVHLFLVNEDSLKDPQRYV